MNKQKMLEQIEKNIKSCKKCGLCKTAQNAVAGEGNINADIVFVGEAPGANEDATGRPFVGRAGRVLEQMLEKIGYTREDVWIGNVIKHRPPKNRDPLPAEIKACENYLTMQLETIKPKLVVTLGRFAMHYFYAEGKISKDHGNLVILNNHNVYPVYHPAAALRNGNFAKALLKDFMQIPKVLEKVKNQSGKIQISQEVRSLEGLGI